MLPFISRLGALSLVMALLSLAGFVVYRTMSGRTRRHSGGRSGVAYSHLGGGGNGHGRGSSASPHGSSAQWNGSWAEEAWDEAERGGTKSPAAPAPGAKASAAIGGVKSTARPPRTSMPADSW